jgi:hypothetical protein
MEPGMKIPCAVKQNPKACHSCAICRNKKI